MRVRAIWILPAAFLVHDAEEQATMPGWMAEHGAALQAMLSGYLGLPPGSSLGPQTSVGTFMAMLALLILFLCVTAGAAAWPGRRAFRYAYAVLLGGCFLHGFTHLAQALIWGGYTPGAVTAGVVVIPVSLFIYSRLFREEMLGKREALACALAGGALILPAILLALSIAARFEP